MDVGSLSPGETKTIPSSGYSDLWTVVLNSPAGTYTVTVGLRNASTLYDIKQVDTFYVNATRTEATITLAPIGNVVSGNPVTLNYTVTNTGNYSRTFGIGAELRDGPVPEQLV
jgi:hypothetical protein